jgi:fatty acid CoA ligase FadD22
VSVATDNLHELLVGRWLREGHADHTAVVDDGGAWSFAQLDAAAARAAGTLFSAGVRNGDRVAFVLPDSRVWAAAFLGATRLGAVAVALDPDGPVDDPIEDSEPTALVAAPGPGPATVTRIEPGELLEGEEHDVVDVRSDQLAYLVYSSGSTGRPKAAMHSHGDLRTGIETYAAHVLQLTPADRCFSMARLFTSLGFGNGFFRVLGSGATAVLRARQPGASEVGPLIGEEGLTVLSAVPTSWAQLAALARRRPEIAEAIGDLRVGVSSGDAMPPSVADALRETSGLEIMVGLGCSECSNIIISTALGESADGTLGRSVPGIGIDLRGEDDEPVPPGTPGRLWIRSGSNTSGYWRRKELTEDVVRGEWLRMGDMLEERDGRYVYVGRADDMFKVDGGWVSGTQVEAALLEHPAVAEAGVVSRPDGRGLARTSAAIVLEAGADEPATEELRHLVSAGVGQHAIPRMVSVRSELPRVASGKINRRALREEPDTAWA